MADERDRVQAVVVAARIEDPIRVPVVRVDRGGPDLREVVVVTAGDALVDARLRQTIVGQMGQQERLCDGANRGGVVAQLGQGKHSGRCPRPPRRQQDLKQAAIQRRP